MFEIHILYNLFVLLSRLRVKSSKIVPYAFAPLGAPSGAPIPFGDGYIWPYSKCNRRGRVGSLEESSGLL